MVPERETPGRRRAVTLLLSHFTPAQLHGEVCLMSQQNVRPPTEERRERRAALSALRSWVEGRGRERVRGDLRVAERVLLLLYVIDIKLGYCSSRRRSPSLFFLSEPEKRERRWYFCHYLNIISGCRNLYLRCFGVTQPPHRNTPATILAVTSDLASISALPFRYCCKSMMLHERSSQEESLYSTGLSFFTPEMISDLRYLYVSLVDERINALGLWVSFLCHDIMYIAQVASNGRVLTWGAKIIVKLHPTLEGEFDAVLKFSESGNGHGRS
ncbi:hypothetical protein Bca4012_091162 [Brassica carinata]